MSNGRWSKSKLYLVNEVKLKDIMNDVEHDKELILNRWKRIADDVEEGMFEYYKELMERKYEDYQI